MHKISNRALARGARYTTTRVRTGRFQPPTTPGAGPKRADALRSDAFASVSRRYIRALVVLDLVIGLTSFGIATVVDRFALPGDMVPERLAALAAALWPVLIGSFGGYRQRRIGVGTSELRAVLRAGPMLVVLGAYPAALTGRVSLLTITALTVPLCLVLSMALRLAARRYLHRLQGRGIGSRRTLAVGPADAVVALEEALRREPYCGMHVIAACVPVGQAGDNVGVPVVGNLTDVRTVVERDGYEAVAVAGGECLREDFLRRLSWSLEGVDVELLVSPGLAEVVRPRLDIKPLVGMPLLSVQQPRFTGWRHAVKRALDLVLTSLGLVALAPLLIGVALAIKLQDGGPVFFRQSRIGRDGQPFSMLKFRSMVIDAEARKAALMSRNEGHGGLFKLRDDPRITPLGQFIRSWSIDELPQLFNVLGGSMSLVGPRPHLAHEIALMPPDAARRALVPPGLTGLWQISGRSDLPGSEGVRLDLRYVENWSITLDLFIIWKTFRAVVSKSGAR